MSVNLDLLDSLQRAEDTGLCDKCERVTVCARVYGHARQCVSSVSGGTHVHVPLVCVHVSV